MLFPLDHSLSSPGSHARGCASTVQGAAQEPEQRGGCSFWEGCWSHSLSLASLVAEPKDVIATILQCF